MTYGAFESSPDSGSPIELYVYRVGLRTFYYTSANVDVPLGQDTYVAEPIKRSRIDLTHELNKQHLTVEVSRDNTVAGFFRFSPPDEVVSLTVLRMHEQDPDQETVVIWMGRVLNAKWSGLTAKLYCEPVSTSLRRTGLRRHYQRNCPHELYGPYCKANRTNYRFQGQVSAINGLNITVPGTGDQSDGYYSGGYVEWSDSDGILNSRTIESHSGDVLTLTSSSYGIAENQDLDVYAGCGHFMDDCDGKFGNSENYGGTTLYQPSNNPFNSKVF